MERTLSRAVGIQIGEPMPCATGDQPGNSAGGWGPNADIFKQSQSYSGGSLLVFLQYVLVGRGVHRANGCGPLAAVSLKVPTIRDFADYREDQFL